MYRSAYNRVLIDDDDWSGQLSCIVRVDFVCDQVGSSMHNLLH